MSPELIETSTDMEALLTQLNNQTIIAVDTEFFRETSYYPKLALVQIATDSVVACIDPLAFDARPALRSILLNSEITKIFHSCSQDLEVLFYYLGEAPNVIYDTQIANSLLNEHHQIGYAKLVEKELGTLLDKSQTRTNWLQRPLTSKQIQYAGDDVLYLYKLQHILDEKLQKLDRKVWFDEESKKLLNDQYSFQPDSDTLWKRVKGSSRLNRKKLAIVQSIALWREHLAKTKDRTRRRILADDIVIDLALSAPVDNAPEDTQAIEKIIGRKYHFNSEEKQQLQTAISDALQIATEDCPQNQFTTLDCEQKLLLKTLQKSLNTQAEKLNISASVLCSRKELEKLILWQQQTDDTPPELNILQGWRYDCIGQQLLDIVQNHGQK
jgi:ribonuclease D